MRILISQSRVIFRALQQSVSVFRGLDVAVHFVTPPMDRDNIVVIVGGEFKQVATTLLAGGVRCWQANKKSRLLDLLFGDVEHSELLEDASILVASSLLHDLKKVTSVTPAELKQAWDNIISPCVALGYLNDKSFNVLSLRRFTRLPTLDNESQARILELYESILSELSRCDMGQTA